MSQQPIHRPREITAAAIVAFIGSALFILAALLLAASIAAMLMAFAHKYPGVSLHSKDPDLRQIQHFIVLSISIALVLGVVGIVTGRGLLRLRPWTRLSAIAWSIGSSLVCLTGLAVPTTKSGMHFSATGIPLLMLFLFPVNVWRLMLFFRPSTKSLVMPTGTSRRTFQPPEWLQENFMAKLVIALAAILLLIGGASWMMRRNSPMQEMERARDAVTGSKSWHFHTVRYIPTLPPETIDMDTLCPAFQHRAASYEDSNGAPRVRDSIRYFTLSYNHVGDRWLPAQKLASQQTDPGSLNAARVP